MRGTTLVQGFARHIRDLKSPEYKESQVRRNYIDPFWELLGWDVTNAEQRAPQEVDVVYEPSMDSADDDGLKSREPDYLFRANGFPRFIVEAKKPSVDLDTAKEAIFQAKRYAWSATIPFAILTDFEQFRIYDATLKPILNEPLRGLIREFSIDYQNYPDQWDVLSQTFGREAVIGGSLERLFAKVKHIKPGRRIRTVDRMLIDFKGAEPVDAVFLDHLEKFRQQFARRIYEENKKEFPEADTLHGAAKLTECVQRLIDRLVFMRVCEDRGIAEYGALRKTLDRISHEGGDFYASLCAQFRDLDGSYNGYLFKPHFSEQLTVPDHTLADFVRTLYPPDGAWNFAAIADDILGIVYERFLGHVVAVKRGIAQVDEKPEVRHAGGVYYTPRFIVDSIIRRVVGPKVAGKSPAQVLNVQILDPACGSGSFLVAAFQFLIDHCITAIRADPNLAKVPATPRARKARKEIAFQNKKGQWILAPDFRAALLTSCIHGVDIDQQAVEVTVMSLYLKMLEGELPPNWQREWLENELLPSLDNNILCGNSLVDPAGYDAWAEKTKKSFFDEDKDTAFRINRFDWRSRTRGFGRILDDNAVLDRERRGFDCIIGNPPYIRVQELNKWAPDECEFYKWKYKSAAKGNYDIYVVFTERALSLLAPDGLLGFIMPHKFWQAKYGEGLRRLISDGGHLRNVVDFTHNLVFKNASIYTAIHVLSKNRSPSGRVSVERIDDLTDGPTQIVCAERGESAAGIQSFGSPHPAGDAAWSIVPPNLGVTMRSLEAATEMRLGFITERMAQGIRTSANPVYVLGRTEKRSNRFFSSHLGCEVELEPGLMRCFLGADQMRRYEIVPGQNVVLIPYECKPNGGWQLIDPSQMKKRYPATWHYLKQCEPFLRGREDGKMDRPEWYGFVYPKNLDVMGASKILVPDIVEHASFSVDAKGAYAFVSGYAITLKPDFVRHSTLVLALLNSKLLGDFLKAISTPLRGGWYRPFPQFMGKIPIKLPIAPGERRLAEQITESVRMITDAKAALRAENLSDRQKAQLESNVESHEKRIDEAVFALYGVSMLPS